MNWFGESWQAPMNDPAEQVATPVGATCLHCEEQIEARDRGVYVGSSKGPAPMHLECFMRGVVGSVGHQRGACACYGGNEDDPPGATTREAARAAYEYFKCHLPHPAAELRVNPLDGETFRRAVERNAADARRTPPEQLKGIDMTETLSVILDLQKEFTAITDGDVARAARHLSEIRKSERTLGTVHNVDARKLWAMADAFEGRAARAAIEAKFTAESDEQEAEAARSLARASQIERMVREIFWTQVKEDIGGEAWTAAGGIGLRAGWMVVACSKSPILNIIESIARGGDPE